MIKYKNKGFTLVELIVVITILAILGTIAFISLQGFSSSARDSKRISDMNNIKTTLELFGLNTGKFPTPTNPYPVTFSGAEIRLQGTFGEQNVKNVEKIGKLPLDPLTQLEYTYSVTSNKKEFELGTIIESDTLTYNNINEVNAATRKTVRAYIKGNYNGKTLKTSTGGLDYVLAIPSIINGDYTIKDIFELAIAKKMAYHGYNNLPASYTGSVFEVNGEDDLVLVNPNEIVIFSGSTTDLIDPEDSEARIKLLQEIKEAYTGTDLEDEGGIEEIVNLDLTDSSNPTDQEESIAGSLVNKSLGGSVEVVAYVVDGGDEGGEGSLVCEDMTSENVSNLNTAFSSFGYGSYTKTDRCNLTIFNLGDKGLDSLPDDFGYLTNLEELYLHENNFTSLPDTFGNLTNLTELDLSYIGLDTINENIGNFVNLENLRLGGNNFSSIPDTFWDLTNLSNLDLSNNSFTALSSDIGNFTSLENLRLGSNFLTSLPSTLSNLGNLNRLYLSRNSSLGNLNADFDGESLPATQTDIVTGGGDMTIGTALGKVEITVVLPLLCATELNYPNAIFINGEPEIEGTSWQNDNDTEPCYYKCKVGFGGEDCNTVVPLTLYERMFYALMGDGDTIEYNTLGTVLEYNNKLYFNNNDSYLMSIDGSSNYNNISYNSTDLVINEKVISNNELYLGVSNDAIYKIDINDNITKVTDGLSLSSISALLPFNSKLYFLANSSVNGYKELWITDGTPSGTEKIHDFVWQNTNYAVYNGLLYFGGYDSTNGRELWSTDGTVIGTTFIKDIYSGTSGSSPYGFTVYNGKIYFAANNNTNGIELWVSDGTSDGTILLKDIYVGSEDGYPNNFLAHNNKLYFSANDGTNGREYWMTDGTSLGTSMVYDSLYTVGSTYLGDLVVFDDKMFFKAHFDDGLYYINTDNSVVDFTASTSKIEMYTFMDNKLYFGQYCPLTTPQKYLDTNLEIQTDIIDYTSTGEMTCELEGEGELPR